MLRESDELTLQFPTYHTKQEESRKTASRNGICHERCAGHVYVYNKVTMTKMAFEDYAFPKSRRSLERGVWPRNEGQDIPFESHEMKIYD